MDGHALCQQTDNISCAPAREKDAGGGVAERRELFSSSHGPTDSRAWAEADAKEDASGNPRASQPANLLLQEVLSPNAYHGLETMNQDRALYI